MIKIQLDYKRDVGIWIDAIQKAQDEEKAKYDQDADYGFNILDSYLRGKHENKLHKFTLMMNSTIPQDIERISENILSEEYDNYGSEGNGELTTMLDIFESFIAKDNIKRSNSYSKITSKPTAKARPISQRFKSESALPKMT